MSQTNSRITAAAFVDSVFTLSGLPQTDLPEVAFAGKSNVGKSSLLNRLLGRQSLVKVSSRPGFTQSINFFLVNNSVYFVDLPGYGYAKAPKTVKRRWRELVDGYLRTRKQLNGVVCIFDMRREPDRLDLDLLDYLHALGKKYWIVLNKADKISQPKRARKIRLIRERLPRSACEPVVFSAATGEGVQDLLDLLWRDLGISES